MFCERCGGELRQDGNKLICRKCGIEYGLDYSDGYNVTYSVGGEQITPRGFSSKKIIVIIVIVAIFVLGGVCAGIAVGTSNQNTQVALSGLRLAEKYLSEQNYEQAIIAFEQILKIEPMNVDAYIGLADAYEHLGDHEKAIKVLNDGYKLTGAKNIESQLHVLQESVTSSSARSSVSQSELSSTSSLVEYSKPADSEITETVKLNYIDVSKQFDLSDTLHSSGEGQIITATAAGAYQPYKSVYLSDDVHFIDLSRIFDDGIYLSDSGDMILETVPDLVHNSGTHYIYKATKNGVEVVKTSPYPMYVTQEGYIAYYASRNDSSVTVNVQSPNGKVISSTTIEGYSDFAVWNYGFLTDRLSINGCVTGLRGLKGAAFSYYLYDMQIRNTVTGYYDTKLYNYLFFTTGEVILDETQIEADAGESPSYPSKLAHSGNTYMPAIRNVKNYGNSIAVVEYYDINHPPEEGLDYDYIEPEYSAFAVVNTGNDVHSRLYKVIVPAGNGTFIATDFDGTKCYLNGNGQEISSKYENIGEFSGEFSFVKENGTYYLINRNFDKLMEIEGSDIKAVGDDMFSSIIDGKLHLVRVD